MGLLLFIQFTQHHHSVPATSSGSDHLLFNLIFLLQLVLETVPWTCEVFECQTFNFHLGFGEETRLRKNKRVEKLEPGH